MALNFADLENFHLAGIDDRPKLYTNIATNLCLLGHWQYAAQFAAYALMVDPHYTDAIEDETNADVHLGQYQKAIDTAAKATSPLDVYYADEIPFAYAMLNRPGDMEAYIAAHKDLFTGHFSPRPYDAYAQFLKGEPLNIPALAAQLSAPPAAAGADMCQLLCQADLLQHTRFVQVPMLRYLAEAPNERLLWVLADTYEQHSPGPTVADLFFSLSRLYPEDPWCQGAEGQFKQMVMHTPMIPVELVERGISQCPDERYPFPDAAQKTRALGISQRTPSWVVASSVFRLLDEGQRERAHELALRYHWVAVQSQEPELVVYATHLIHCTEDEGAKEDAASAPARSIGPVVGITRNRSVKSGERQEGSE